MKSVARLLTLAVLLQVLIVMPPAIDSAAGQVAAALAINDASGGEAEGRVVFTVTRSGNTLTSVTATYTTVASGSATAGTDYPHPQTGSISFAANDTSEQITIVTTDDAVTEPSETFQVQLTSASPLTASIADGTGIGTIVDDDVFVSIADLSKLEGTGGTTQFGFNVTLAPVSQNPVAVTYATAPSGTATSGTDYQPITGTVVIPAGQSQVTASVTVIADNIDELNETFTVNLTDATNARISDGQAVGTIQDDDGPPAISVSDVSRTEGTGGTSPATFTLSLDRASSLPITVTSTTQDRTASAPSDYQTRSEATTFAPGETSKQVPVTIVGDGIDEPDETFALLLQSSSNATINDGTGIATILDDDAAPSVSIGDASGAEGTVIQFPVSLSAPSGRTVTVTYTTAPGTAAAGADYSHTVGTVVFSPGQVNQTANVSASSDAVNESNETFSVNLSSPVNATIADGTGAGTITNVNIPPEVSIGNASAVEEDYDDDDSSMSFTLSLSAPSQQTVEVTYRTVDGVEVTYGGVDEGAYSSYDFEGVSEGRVLFQPGVTAAQIRIPLIEDTEDEGNETFKVELLTASNAIIGNGVGTGTIIDDDPKLYVTDGYFEEKNPYAYQPPEVIHFRVILKTITDATDEPVTVSYATSDGSAKANSDYVPASGTLVFEPGETSKTVAISISDDSEVEDDEVFYLNISNARNAAIAVARGTGHIYDDDYPLGYWMVARDGGIFTFGDASFYGSMGGTRLDQGVVGMDSHPGGEGYWLVASDGGVFSFGDSWFHGSMGGQPLAAPVVGMAATPSGEGYWLVAADGGVFTFGDARFYGSWAGQGVTDAVAIVAHPDGDGYWIFTKGGASASFGSAGYLGTSYSRFRRAVGADLDQDSWGAYVVDSDGAVYKTSMWSPTYGDMRGRHLAYPMVGMTVAPNTAGYWLAAADGGVFSFGVPFLGGMGHVRLDQPVVGIEALFS